MANIYIYWMKNWVKLKIKTHWFFHISFKFAFFGTYSNTETHCLNSLKMSETILNPAGLLNFIYKAKHK